VGGGAQYSYKLLKFSWLECKVKLLEKSNALSVERNKILKNILVNEAG
jgi:hypothetical protein